MISKNVDMLLIYPRPTLDSPLQELALGIMYVGANLEKAGFNVEYYDERFDDVQTVWDMLASGGVKAVGVSAMTGYQLKRTEEFFTEIKKKYPAVKKILGGVHASLLPEQSLRNDFVDIVTIGEGEETTLELMRAITDGKTDYSGIKGIGWKKDGKITLNPLREFIDPKDIIYPLTAKNRKYFEIAAKTGEISFPTSRGCPHKCRFCYNLVFNRRTWRPIPIELFEEQFNRLMKDLSHVKFDNIFLLDDNIGRGKARLLAIKKLMEKHGLTWHTSIRPEYLDEETSRLLDDGNCRSLLLGIESGSDRVLKDVIGKDLPRGVEDIKQCARNLSKTGIGAIYSFMYGLPTETAQDRRASFDLADWIARTDPNARISFYVYAPYPGTDLYREAVKSGFHEPKSFEEWSNVTLSSSKDDIAENVYYIAGLNFRGKKGDRTDQNFPGWHRLKIMPFELLIKLRWRLRFFRFFGFEKKAIKFLLERASARVRKK